MGIAALVLGIASIFCGILGVFGLSWAGVVLGAVGIVLGAIARKNCAGGMATAGFVLSIIGASVSILYLIGLVVLVAWLGNAFGTIV